MNKKEWILFGSVPFIMVIISLFVLRLIQVIAQWVK